MTHEGPAGQNAAPTTTFHRSAAWTIDRALKALATACDDEDLPFPGVYLVTVDAASISVTVSMPSAKAPAGWTASNDGRTWSAQLAALQASNVRDAHGHSFAGLVMLGASDDGQVLLDLDQAGGPISVGGPKGAVDKIVEDWVTELTANPWSATVRVARINARNEPDLQSAENLLADLDVGERALIVFEEPPSRSQTAALQALFTSTTTAWILIKGAAPVATWKFTADGGLLSSGFLPDIRYNASPGTPGQKIRRIRRIRRMQWKSPWVLGGAGVVIVVVAAVAAATLSGGGTRLHPVADTSPTSPTVTGSPTASASAASPKAASPKATSQEAASTHPAAPAVAATPAESSPAPQPTATQTKAAAAPTTVSVPEPLSWWYLNEGTGTTTVPDTMGLHPATASNITWATPQYGNCADFNGTDSDFTTSGPVLDTAPGSSFTVSAYVYMTAAIGAAETIVSQDGTYDSGFYLQYSGINDRWAFSRVTEDTDTGPAGIRALSTSAPALSTWTHLVGVFDASDNQLRLYVNGVLQGTATDSSPFAAPGDLAIGRAQFGGKPTDWFKGSAIQIKVYNVALTTAQVDKISS